MDLERYSGRWFEIARTPNPFEQGCYTSTADYIQEGDELVVINTCYYQDDTWTQNVGRAVPKPGGLTVSFNYLLTAKAGETIPSFPGDYKVLWTDYQTFSFVSGGPFYWILSRNPDITEQEKRALIRKTVELGYSPRDLIWRGEGH